MSQRDRVVRVATVTQDYLNTPSQEAFADTLERLDWAASHQPDIVLLPEVCAGMEPEPITGPAVTRVSEWARAHAAYVICPVVLDDAGTRFNSAVIVGRRGEVVGRCDKAHPTNGELEKGVRPGPTDPPVFDLDFGGIGIRICFDVNWREEWHALKRKGAEIIFWPSAYPAHRHLSALAWQLQVYLVSATISRASRIYDITGEVLAQSGMFAPWAEADLHLGKRLFEIDYHIEQMREIERKYGRRVQVKWYHDEDWFTLASLDPELSVADLIAEFGLTPLTEYHAACEAAQDRARPRG